MLNELKKDKIDIFDVFSGSGIVSRFFKQYSKILYTNDLEDYCYTINKCYLSNKSNIDLYNYNYWYDHLNNLLTQNPLKKDGFIARLYSPKDDNDIQIGERVFYTRRNAEYIDTARQYIESLPHEIKPLFLGPLLYEASTKNNTSGVFKGFYKNSDSHIGQFGGNGKNALKRILDNIELKKPVLSNYECDVFILQGDANKICKSVPHVDLAYLDPPYNQHPYGSNYFMLNLINNYKEPIKISNVSGIPDNWSQSNYNKKRKALLSLKDLCEQLKATYVLISYNSEGFITLEDMIAMLEKIGLVRVFDKNYNVFRGSRNLKNRDIHVKEYLFLLKKG